MTIPYLKQNQNKKVLMVDNQPFIMIAGEIHNSSATSIKKMKDIFFKAKTLHLNSLLIPVTWEIIEPQENHFDFTIVDYLIKQARKNQLKLCLLWFGS